MLSFEEIKELIELVAEHRLSGFEIERAGFRFKIEGRAAAESVIATALPPPAATPIPVSAPLPPPAVPAVALEAPPASASKGLAPPAGEAATQADEPGDDTHELTSPIVGTFYRSPSPEDEPFVEVGSRVRRGQVLCIVEAMKLMNEIESDVDGVVAEILPKNAQPVEFGEPLFRIRLT